MAKKKKKGKGGKKGSDEKQLAVWGRLKGVLAKPARPLLEHGDACLKTIMSKHWRLLKLFYWFFRFLFGTENAYFIAAL